MGDINIGNDGGKISDSKINVAVGGESAAEKQEPSPSLIGLKIDGETRSDTVLNFIDKYLVPIYNRDGIVPVIVILTILLAFVLFAFYLGIGGIVTEWLR